MDNNGIREQIKLEIERRITGGGKYPHRKFSNYLNKNTGGESWQHELDAALATPGLDEVWVLAGNSVGKSFKVAHLIAQIMENDHPFCKNFNTPIHIHVISHDFPVQKQTIQTHLDVITNYEMSGVAGMGNLKKYKIYSQNSVLKEIINLQNKNKVTFTTADKGATGIIGVRPHLLLSDEPIAQSVYEELVVRTTTKDSKFLMLCTVLDSDHAWVVVKACEHLEKPSESRRIITARMIDSPFVPQSKVDHFARTYGENSPQYRVRVLGSLEMVTGTVYEGIEDCVVPNGYIPEEFRKTPFNKLSNHYIWAESHDYGISAKDPTFIGFFRIWSNGEIVQEDEICLYKENDIQIWCDEIHKKRTELDMPYLLQGYPKNREVLDFNEKTRRGTRTYVRKPTICVGDKQYLARSTAGNNSKLKLTLAERNIFVTPSKCEPVLTTLPVCQSLVKQKVFKLKERCVASYKFARSYMTRFNETSGKVTYDSPYDHWSDVFRYLIERLGGTNHYIQSIEKRLQYENSLDLRQNIINDVNKHKRI